MLWSELAPRVKERFCAPACSIRLCFLHLLIEGANMPSTMITTANAIKSHKDPRLAGAAGGMAAAAGVPSVSGDGLAVAAGVVVAASDGLTSSEDLLAVTAGLAAATGVAGRL